MTWKPLSRMAQQREEREYEIEREIRSDLELEAEEQQ